MLQKSKFAQWNNKESIEFSDFEHSIMEAHEQGTDSQQIILEDNFQDIFSNPELEITEANIVDFMNWFSRSGKFANYRAKDGELYLLHHELNAFFNADYISAMKQKNYSFSACLNHHEENEIDIVCFSTVIPTF